MRIVTAIFLTLWFALPGPAAAEPVPTLSWAGKKGESIRVQAEGEAGLLDRCLDGGIEVRYRYELRYCKRGKYWFDKCQEPMIEIRSIKFEPIKETFRVQTDRLRDQDKPQETTFSSKEEALKQVHTIERVALERVSRGRYRPDDSKQYISARLLSDCKGSLGSTLLDISYYLTFGLFKNTRFDSGWIDYRLDDLRRRR